MLLLQSELVTYPSSYFKKTVVSAIVSGLFYNLIVSCSGSLTKAELVKTKRTPWMTREIEENDHRKHKRRRGSKVTESDTMDIVDDSSLVALRQTSFYILNLGLWGGF